MSYLVNRLSKPKTKPFNLRTKMKCPTYIGYSSINCAMAFYIYFIQSVLWKSKDCQANLKQKTFDVLPVWLLCKCFFVNQVLIVLNKPVYLLTHCQWYVSVNAFQLSHIYMSNDWLESISEIPYHDSGIHSRLIITFFFFFSLFVFFKKCNTYLYNLSRIKVYIWTC